MSVISQFAQMHTHKLMISPVTERLIDFLPLKTSLQFSSQMQLGWTSSTAPKYKTNSVYLEQVL